ncbi:MAG: aminopeptidase, partial [Clostridia bacterium]|nr:aminopeptidase [Clostridia bacterium]
MTEKEFYEKLTYKTKIVYDEITTEQAKEMLDLCDRYRDFLDNGKTERECINLAIKMAEENGFKPLDTFDTLKAGDKVYTLNRGKNILLAVMGEKDLENGVNLVGAHIDSPRLDIKQNPLYESNDLAMLKTHYYGGIKKYQWTAIPLALHGVVCKTDG